MYWSFSGGYYLNILVGWFSLFGDRDFHGSGRYLLCQLQKKKEETINKTHLPPPEKME